MTPDDPRSIPTQAATRPGEPPPQGFSGSGDATVLSSPAEAGDPNPGALFAHALTSEKVSGAAGANGWVPPTVEELQRMLPQYEISEIIGCGGMGAVYKGVQRSLDRPVAIKIFPMGIEDDAVHYAERFKIEAKAMARLSHPGIVAVFDAGETAEGLLYFVMEFIEGTDVQKMIAQGPLPPATALTITAHVCDALGFAHESGIVHRDIKPANIMVDARGHVKVADFGLAKVTTQDSGGFTGTHFTMGTPNYIAPEAMTSVATVDGRADLYAVGVMLYAMLTGDIPRGRFALPSTRVAGLDPRFDAIVDKAMQADRENRYASAAALRTDLDGLLTAPIPVDAPLPRRSKMPWLVAAVVIVALLSGGGWWFAQQKKAGISAPVGTVADSPESRAAALAANPANWVDRLTTRKWEGAWVWENAVLKTTDKMKALSGTVAMMADGAIRVRARADRNKGTQLQLILRGGAVPGVENTTGLYQLQTNAYGTSCSLLYAERRNKAGETETRENLWTKMPVPPAVAGQTEIEWELRAVGDEFSAWANGQFVASARHTRVPRGNAAFTSDVGLEITKVETIDFTSGSAPASLQQGSAAPATWVPVTLSQATVSKQLGASLNAEGELTTAANFGLREISARDIAFRAEVRMLPEKGGSAIQLRRVGAESYRQLSVNLTNARLQIPKPDGKFPTLSLLDYPPGMDITGKWVPVEFATVGRMSFGTVQSLPFTPGVSDEALLPGEVGFKNLQLRKMEIMLLDGVPETQWPEFIRAGMKASAPSAASAKQAPPADKAP